MRLLDAPPLSPWALNFGLAAKQAGQVIPDQT
jgi:hypothetical protein